VSEWRSRVDAPHRRWVLLEMTIDGEPQSIPSVEPTEEGAGWVNMRFERRLRGKRAYRVSRRTQEVVSLREPYVRFISARVGFATSITINNDADGLDFVPLPVGTTDDFKRDFSPAARTYHRSCKGPIFPEHGFMIVLADRRAPAATILPANGGA
jgi:hypothetical protein